MTKGPIDRILDLNRTILSRIIGDKTEMIVSHDYLLGAGFNFAYYSFSYSIEKVTFFGIYEFEIGKIFEGKYKIKKIDNEKAS